MIRKRAWLTGAALTGTLAVTGFGTAALAADVVEEAPNCAVSGFNGKLVGGAGYADRQDEDGSFAFEAGGSLSLPLGCLIGLQLDGGVSDKLDDTMFGGIAHLFIRDPESYLLGVTGGVIDGENATLYPVGPEAELYLGNISLEAWGGYLNLDQDHGGSEDTGFVIADAALYLTDDFRVSVGGKIVDDYEGVRAGFEYQFDESPMSLYAKAEYGDDDYFTVLGGLKFYFGGEQKSLIRRHREDDPRNRTLDLFVNGIGKDHHKGYGN
jgi:opacity protein-like surface antigen